MKIVKIGLLVVIIGIFAAEASLGAEVVIPTREDGANLSVPQGETHRNLYVAGGNLTVGSETKGDLYAAGGMVTVTGAVEEDLVVAGGSLNVTGRVGGDARVAGGNVVLSGEVAGDLVVAGGNITVSQSAAIGGDLLIAGGNVIMEAPVAGYVRFMGGNLALNSRVAGDFTARVQDKLVFGPKSEVVGKASYEGRREAVIREGAKVGSLEFKKLPQRQWRALLTVGIFIRLLAWLLAAYLLIRLVGRLPREITASALARPWHNLGTGFLGGLAIPVIVVLLFITGIGYYAAGILGTWFALMLLLARLLAAIYLGMLVLQWLSEKTETPNWQAVLVGVVIFQVLSFLPVAGFVVQLVFSLITFGAILRVAKTRILES